MKGKGNNYCIKRTRRRLARLVWAVIYLSVGLMFGIVFMYQLQEDKSAWKIEDYALLVVMAIVGAGGLMAGVYEAYTDLRDAFFPGKSRLAQSIRSQLFDPQDPIDYRRLFEMVDRDIAENGIWFDRMAIGEEWILGDDITHLSRVRAVFGRDEIIKKMTGNRSHTFRVLEIYIVDDRKQTQITGFRNPKELEAAIHYLKEKIPAAVFPPYKEYAELISKNEMEWQKLEMEYRRYYDEK